MKYRWIQWSLVIGVWLGASVISGMGCGAPDVTTPSGECRSALECPGSQLCIDGKCTTVGVDSGGSSEVAADGAQEIQSEPVTEPKTEPGQEPAKEPAQEPTTDGGEPTPETPTETSADGPQCIDKDNDGYCENIPGDRGEKDCDDNNKEIYPTATELCNGKDDDCDGQTDEDLTPPPCFKADGVCKGAVKTCDGANGWQDCSAADYTKHSKDAYEVTEKSCDGEDNDCDGQTDETFEEQGKDCTDTTQKGECQRGKYECKNGKLECISTTKSVTEVCDNQKDDDCDGEIDENPPCACTPGKTEACYPGTQGCTGSNGNYNCTAPCQAGKRTCGSNSQWGACKGAVVASKEVCDGKDNDCNGRIDETFPTLGRACTEGKGDCARTGKIVCSTTTTTKCDAVPGRPIKEVCDGRDNDCDGQIDESLPLTVYYQDLDRDGYGNESVPKKACAQPKGYVAKTGDCYDKNPNARPGQTNFFTTHRGDGSFDYNCDKRSIRKPMTCRSCLGKEWASSSYTCGKAGPTNSCVSFPTCKKSRSSSVITPCN